MRKGFAALGLVALAVAAAAISLGADRAAAQDQTVAVGDNFFQPANVTVNVGDTVTWNWQGALPHTVTANDGAFDSPQQTSGSFSFTFDTAGTFNYFCEVHGQAMSGSVTVQAAAGEQPTQPPAAGQPTQPAAQPTAARTPSAAGTAVAAPQTGTGPGGGSSDAMLIIALASMGAAMAAGVAFVAVRARS